MRKFLTEEDDNETEIEFASQFADEIIEAITKLKWDADYIKKKMLEEVKPIVAPKDAKMPTYDGSLFTWSTFWSQFEVTVHKNSNLSDIKKFTYLKSFLKGEAESAITCLTLVSDNYPIAIDILHSRFENKQLRISAHMKELRSLQPVVHLDDIVSMRKLYNTLELNINNLKELEVDVSTYGTLLIAIIFNCIPDELRVKASLQFGEKDWSLKGTLEIIKHELEARERSSVIKKEQFEYNSRDYVTTQNLKFDTVKENFQNKLCRKVTELKIERLNVYFVKESIFLVDAEL